MRLKRSAMLFSLMGCCIFLFLASGCGKKGPPLPPEIKGQKISAPFDLKYTIDDTGLRLSWRHTVDADTAAVKPDAFEIFMAQKTFDACEGCPFEFKSMGLVSMPSMDVAIKIEKGFKYYFRIQATGKDNMRSEYSKTIHFEHK